jgi:hypothetical protein
MEVYHYGIEIPNLNNVLSRIKAALTYFFTVSTECGENEEYVQNMRYCARDTCQSLRGPRRSCPPPRPILRPGCQCLDNYVRDSDGICIPIEDCPRPEDGKIIIVYSKI